MSQFRSLASGVCANPWIRNVRLNFKSQSLPVLQGGRPALLDRRVQENVRSSGAGGARSIHSSSVAYEATTFSSSLTPGANIEVNVESIGNVGESIQSLAAGGAAPVTLESPSTAVGFLFSDSAPVLAAQDLLYQVKDLPGMEWSSTIVLTTLGIRLLVGLPIAVTQNRSMAKLQAIQPEIKELATNLARETSIAVKIYNWDKRKANKAFKKSFKKHFRTLMEQHNCHPMRSVALGLLQVPFWICLSGAIRNVVYCLPSPATDDMLMRWTQIASESTPWLDSLAATDPIILPVIFLSANLLNIQLNSLRQLAVPRSNVQKIVPWVFRIGVTGIAVFAMFTPAAVTMYWATSSVLALLQNVLFRMNRVRRIFRLPPLVKP